MRTFVIEGKLPTLNDYTNSNRTHWGSGAADKLNATQKCARAAKDIDPTGDEPIRLHYVWYSSTKHDYDNIAFGQKFIQDGLKMAGKITDDNRKIVKGFTHEFETVAKGQDKVVVTLELI